MYIRECENVYLKTLQIRIKGDLYMNWLKKEKKTLLVLLILVLAIITSCDIGMDLDAPKTIKLDKTTISFSSLIQAEAQGIISINATVSTAGGGTSSSPITWSVVDFDNKKNLVQLLVTEGNFCQFKILDAGTFIIKASVQHRDNTLTAYCSVNVSGSVEALVITDPLGGTEYNGVVKLSEGEQLTLRCNFLPAGTSQTGVVWSSSDDAIASIATDVTNKTKAVVVARAEGSTNIAVRSVANPLISKSFSLKVVKSIVNSTTAPASVTITGPGNIGLDVGASKNISAVVLDGYGHNVTNAEVEWESIDPLTVSVTKLGSLSASIKMLKAGTTQVLVTVKGTTISSFVEVKASNVLSSISTNTDSMNIPRGSYEKIKIQFIPNTATNTSFIAESDNNNIVKVQATDKDSVTVSTLAKGVATIKVKAIDNPKIYKDIIIKVVDPSGVNSNLSAVRFNSGKTSLTPPYSSKQEAYSAFVYDKEGNIIQNEKVKFTFTSDISEVSTKLDIIEDTNIVYVSPLKPANIMLIATSVKDPSLSATLPIVQEGKLEALTPSSSALAIKAGLTENIIFTPTPQNAIFSTPIYVYDHDILDVAPKADNPLSLDITALSEGSSPVTVTVDNIQSSIQVGVSSIATKEEAKAASISLSTYYEYLKQDSDPIVINAQVKDSEGALINEDEIQWTVKNEAVVSYRKSDTENGLGAKLTVSPKNAGNTLITASLKNNPNIKADVYVEVGGSAVQGNTLRAITPSNPSITIKKGKLQQIYVNLIPSNASDNLIAWSSSSRSVATVSIINDSDQTRALINAIEEGTTVITATSRTNSEIQTNFVIQVVGEGQAILPKIASVNVYRGEALTSAFYTKIGDGNETLTAKLLMSDKTEASGAVNWSFSNKDKITIVDEAPNYLTFKAAQAGSTVITATAKNNPDAAAQVYVQVLAKDEDIPDTFVGVYPGMSSATVKKGLTVDVPFEILPPKYSIGTIGCEVEDNSIASATISLVDKKVTVKGLKAGKTIVNLIPLNDEAFKKSFSINVVDSTEPIDTEISKIDLDMYYMSYDLAAKANPVITASVFRGSNEDSFAEVIWSVENEELVKLTNLASNKVAIAHNGKVGTTKVICKSVANPLVTASCLVEIIDSSQTKEYLRGFSMSIVGLSLPLGSSQNFVLKTIPESLQGFTDWTFEYSKSGIVEISPSVKNGEYTLKGIKAGDTTIKINAKYGANSYSKQMSVHIYQQTEGVVNKIVITDENNKNVRSLKLMQDSDPVFLTAYAYDQFNNKIQGKINWKYKDGKSFTIKDIGDSNTIGILPSNAGTDELIATLEKNTDVSSSVIITTGAYQKDSTLKKIVTSNSSLSLLVNQKETVSAYLVPSDTPQKNLIWKSSNNGIFTVTSNGLEATVTAVKTGDAILSVRSKDAPEIVSEILIHVIDSNSGENPSITSVTLDRYYLSYEFGAKALQTINAKVFKNGVYDPKLSVDWTVEKSDILVLSGTSNTVLVNHKGKVGSSYVTATSKDNKLQSAACYVEVSELKVNKEVKLQGLAVDSSKLILLEGTEDTITFSPIPSSSIIENWYFESSDANIASVINKTNGKALITAKKVGDVTITATAIDGYGIQSQKTIFIKVEKKAQSENSALKKIIITNNNGTTVNNLKLMQDSDPIYLNVKAYDQFGDEFKGKINWSYEKDKSFALNETDQINTVKISPLNAGTTELIATVEGNTKVSALVVITTGAYQTDLSLKRILTNSSSISLTAGQKGTLDAYLVPANTNQKDVMFTSSDKNVFIVTQVGTVASITAQKVGDAILTIRSSSAPEIFTQIAVHVVDSNSGVDTNITGVTLDRYYLSYEFGAKALQTITAKVFKNGVYDPTAKVDWSVENTDIVKLKESGNTVFVNHNNKEGFTNIYATAKENNLQNASCLIEVTDVGKMGELQLQGVSVSATKITLRENEENNITFSQIPTTVAVSNWNIEMDDLNVATVTNRASGSVYIKGISEGVTTMRIIAVDAKGNRALREIEVNVVKNQVDPEAPRANKILIVDNNGNKTNSLNLMQDSNSVFLAAKIYDQFNNEFSGEVKWSYEKDKAFTTKDGALINTIEIMPQNAGTTELVATLEDNTNIASSVIITTGAYTTDLTLKRIITSNNSIGLKVGQKETVKAYLVPSNTTQKDVEFTSSDKNIFTVTTNGLEANITAVKVGDAILTVRSTISPDIFSQIAVHVIDSNSGVNTAITGVTLDRYYLSYQFGAKAMQTLTAKVFKNGSYDPELLVDWSVENSDIVKVTGTSNTVYVNHNSKEGASFVYATSKDNKLQSASCLVEVADITASDELKLQTLASDSSKIVIVEGKEQTVTFAPVPSTVTVNTWRFETSDSGIATATAKTDGAVTIKGIKEGEASVKAIATDKTGTIVSKTIIVKVVKPQQGEAFANKIIIADESLQQIRSLKLMQDSDPVFISAKVYDQYGNEFSNKIEWTYEKDKAITVKTTKEANIISVLPLNAGSTELIATTPDNREISSSVLITTGAYTSDLALKRITTNNNSIGLIPNQTETIKAFLIPSNTLETEVIFSSSDKNIFTVTQNKLEATIKALKVGDAVLSIQSKTSPEIVAQIAIHVIDSDTTVDNTITGVTFDRYYLSYEFGSKALQTLTAKVFKNGSYDPKLGVDWKIEDEKIVSLSGTGNTVSVNHNSKAGSSYIYATSKENVLQSASCLVEVTDLSVQEDLTLQALAVDSSKIVVLKGKKQEVVFSAVPSSVTVSTWGYESNDSSIAIATNLGNGKISITGVEEGSTIITATGTDAKGNFAKRAINVKVVTDIRELSKYSKIVISPSTFKGTLESETNYVKATVFDNKGKEVIVPILWSIDGESIALEEKEVNEKAMNVYVNVTAPGITYIKATIKDAPDIWAECRFVVSDIISAMSPSSNYIHLEEGANTNVSIKYKSTVTDIKNEAIIWKSADLDVAKVVEPTAYGAKIVGVKKGTTTVTASFKDLKAVFNIIVDDALVIKGGAKNISLNSSYYSLEYPYVKTPFTATVTYQDNSISTIEDIIWEVEDPTILQKTEINNIAYITALKPGQTKITAKLKADPSFTATAIVSVKGNITSIIPSSSEVYVYAGNSKIISVTPSDANSPSSKYIWSIIDDKNKDVSIRSIEGSETSKMLITKDLDLSNPIYDQNPNALRELKAKYPSIVKVKISLDGHEEVFTTVLLHVLFPEDNMQYPKGITLSSTYEKLTPPFTLPAKALTATVTDQDGDPVKATVDWYYYRIGDDKAGTISNVTDETGTKQFYGWLDPRKVTNEDGGTINAYLSEDTSISYLTPKISGQYRVKAIVRENPQYEATCIFNVGGEVTGIASSAGVAATMTEGKTLAVKAILTPSNALYSQAWFALETSFLTSAQETLYKSGKLSQTEIEKLSKYNANEYISFTSDGLAATIDAIKPTKQGKERVLWVEYYDNETLERIKDNPEMYFAIRAETKPLYSAKTVITVVEKSKVIYDLAVTGNDGVTVDPDAISGPLSFTVTASPQTTNESFTAWDEIEATLNLPTVSKGGQAGIIQKDNNFYFRLDKNHIPEEPVIFTVKKKESATSDTILTPASYLMYIGGQVQKLGAATTNFNLNSSQQTVEGTNIDMIAGSNALLNISYNPSITHQKGVFWYKVSPAEGRGIDWSTINDGTSSQCSVYGTTVISSPTVLRAVSYYDPYFQDPKRVDKLPEFARSSEIQKQKFEWGNGLHQGWPTKEEITLYVDYQILIRSLLDKTSFTINAQSKNADDSGGIPTYKNLTSEGFEPKKVVNGIVCYNESSGNTLVDAYYIKAETEPDYGYDFNFKVVDGTQIGTVDVADIEERNAFRFVPKSSNEYGSSTIRISCPTINYSQDFILNYAQGNSKLVKKLNSDETSGDSWMHILDTSYLPEDKKHGVLYPLRCLVLNPGEEYPLGISVGNPFVDGFSYIDQSDADTGFKVTWATGNDMLLTDTREVCATVTREGVVKAKKEGMCFLVYTVTPNATVGNNPEDNSDLSLIQGYSSYIPIYVIPNVSQDLVLLLDQGSNSYCAKIPETISRTQSDKWVAGGKFDSRRGIFPVGTIEENDINSDGEAVKRKRYYGRTYACFTKDTNYLRLSRNGLSGLDSILAIDVSQLVNTIEPLKDKELKDGNNYAIDRESISFFSSEIAKSLPNVEKINLNGINPKLNIKDNILDIGKYYPKVSYLKYTDGKITEDTIIKLSAEIENLDLSNNKISDLTKIEGSGTVKTFPKLKTLVLSNNELSSLPGAVSEYRIPFNTYGSFNDITMSNDAPDVAKTTLDPVNKVIIVEPKKTGSAQINLQSNGNIVSSFNLNVSNTNSQAYITAPVFKVNDARSQTLNIPLQTYYEQNASGDYIFERYPSIDYVYWDCEESFFKDYFKNIEMTVYDQKFTADKTSGNPNYGTLKEEPFKISLSQASLRRVLEQDFKYKDWQKVMVQEKAFEPLVSESFLMFKKSDYETITAEDGKTWIVDIPNKDDAKYKYHWEITNKNTFDFSTLTNLEDNTNLYKRNETAQGEIYYTFNNYVSPLLVAKLVKDSNGESDPKDNVTLSFSEYNLETNKFNFIELNNDKDVEIISEQEGQDGNWTKNKTYYQYKSLYKITAPGSHIKENNEIKYCFDEKIISSSSYSLNKAVNGNYYLELLSYKGAKKEDIKADPKKDSQLFKTDNNTKAVFGRISDDGKQIQYYKIKTETRTDDIDIETFTEYSNGVTFKDNPIKILINNVPYEDYTYDITTGKFNGIIRRPGQYVLKATLDNALNTTNEFLINVYDANDKNANKNINRISFDYSRYNINLTASASNNKFSAVENLKIDKNKMNTFAVSANAFTNLKTLDGSSQKGGIQTISIGNNKGFYDCAIDWGFPSLQNLNLKGNNYKSELKFYEETSTKRTKFRYGGESSEPMAFYKYNHSYMRWRETWDAYGTYPYFKLTIKRNNNLETIYDGEFLGSQKSIDRTRGDGWEWWAVWYTFYSYGNENQLYANNGDLIEIVSAMRDGSYSTQSQTITIYPYGK